MVVVIGSVTWWSGVTQRMVDLRMILMMPSWVSNGRKAWASFRRSGSRCWLLTNTAEHALAAVDLQVDAQLDLL